MIGPDYMIVRDGMLWRRVKRHRTVTRSLLRAPTLEGIQVTWRDKRGWHTVSAAEFLDAWVNGVEAGK